MEDKNSENSLRMPKKAMYSIPRVLSQLLREQKVDAEGYLEPAGIGLLISSSLPVDEDEKGMEEVSARYVRTALIQDGGNGEDQQLNLLAPTQAALQAVEVLNEFTK